MGIPQLITRFDVVLQHQHMLLDHIEVRASTVECGRRRCAPKGCPHDKSTTYSSLDAARRSSQAVLCAALRGWFCHEAKECLWFRTVWLDHRSLWCLLATQRYP